ncbi:hypothetical protein J14TS2_16460 [Bacillus sp. J14TS2]|uniref:hypothetical protein n=1 Tax=Bacillus sp. J14TS2 TaxID=2807188 RepID=UPI001B031B5B|nr:hypothetical protein [Bacillus sp. J14TS2]GIN71171.1 hypothetical protein J14TS2_16460 [Bacillus sp. J14TS2]
MEVFVKQTVFNPYLEGQAVHVTGDDIDGDRYDIVCLVNNVQGDYITLVNYKGELIGPIHLENFTYGRDALKIAVIDIGGNEK